MQCQGITKKGLRCKIETSNGYCHYHESQAYGQKDDGPTVTSQLDKYAKKEGYIYTYSLKRFLNTSNESWLKVKNLPDSKEKHRDKWRDFDSKSSPYILVKIGMTTQTVEKRLKQWESKCHHQLCALTPEGYFDITSEVNGPASSQMQPFKFSKSMHKDSRSESKFHSLVKAFRVLKLKSADSIKYRYNSYNESEFGFFSKNVGNAEADIHKRIKHLYGHGDVLCTGCINKNEEKLKNSRSAPSSFKGNYNIHCEWFLIPKKQLGNVYEVIDQICTKYNLSN